MPRLVFQAWSNLWVPSSSWEPSLTFDPLQNHRLASPEHLLKLKHMVHRNPLASTAKIVEWGRAVNQEEHARHTANMSKLIASKSAKKMNKRERDKLNKSLLLKGADANSKEQHKERMEEMQREFELAERKLNALMEAEPGGTLKPRHFVEQHSDVLSQSLLAPVHIRNSSSTKLNFILHDILRDKTSAKYLIFSKSPLTLAYISESLELFGIKSLQFTSRVNLKAREQAVVTFETSETYRVFLMELKHGARGLWVSSSLS